MIEKFLGIFKLYWGYFMTLVAAGTFIWTLGIKSGTKTVEKQNINSTYVGKDFS